MTATRTPVHSSDATLQLLASWEEEARDRRIWLKSNEYFDMLPPKPPRGSGASTPSLRDQADLLMQISYWCTPDEDGQLKLRRWGWGHYWIVKELGDWWAEIRLAPHAAQRCLKALGDAGLIVVDNHRGGPRRRLRSNHIRLGPNFGPRLETIIAAYRPMLRPPLEDEVEETELVDTESGDLFTQPPQPATAPVGTTCTDRTEITPDLSLAISTEEFSKVTSEGHRRSHHPLQSDPEPEVGEMLSQVNQQYLVYHDTLDPEADQIERQIRYGKAVRNALANLHASERERGRWRTVLAVMGFYYETARHWRQLEAAQPPIWVLGSERQRDEWWRKWGEMMDQQAEVTDGHRSSRPPEQPVPPPEPLTAAERAEGARFLADLSSSLADRATRDDADGTGPSP